VQKDILTFMAKYVNLFHGCNKFVIICVIIMERETVRVP